MACVCTAEVDWRWRSLQRRQKNYEIWVSAESSKGMLYTLSEEPAFKITEETETLSKRLRFWNCYWEGEEPMGSGEVFKIGLVRYYIWSIQCQCPHLRICMCVLSCFVSNSLRPMDCSPPGSSVHGILQARTLEWAAISSSRGSSQPSDQTRIFGISCIADRYFTHWATWESCQHSLGLMSPLTWRQITGISDLRKFY